MFCKVVYKALTRLLQSWFMARLILCSGRHRRSPLRGSSPWPYAYGVHALPTELKRQIQRWFIMFTRIWTLFSQGVIHGCYLYKVFDNDLKQLSQGFHAAARQLSQGVYKAFKRLLQGFHTCLYSVFLQGLRHCFWVAKEMDSKSIGLWPRGLESPRCRSAVCIFLFSQGFYNASARILHFFIAFTGIVQRR